MNVHQWSIHEELFHAIGQTGTYGIQASLAETVDLKVGDAIIFACRNLRMQVKIVTLFPHEQIVVFVPFPDPRDLYLNDLEARYAECKAQRDTEYSERQRLATRVKTMEQEITRLRALKDLSES